MKCVLSIIFISFSIAVALSHSGDVSHVVTLSFNSGVARNHRVLYQRYLATNTDLGKFDLDINELIEELIDAKEDIKEQIFEALGFELEPETNSTVTGGLMDSQNLVNSTESGLQAAGLAVGNATAADTLGTTLANINNSSNGTISNGSTTLPATSSIPTK